MDRFCKMFWGVGKAIECASDHHVIWQTQEHWSSSFWHWNYWGLLSSEGHWSPFDIGTYVILRGLSSPAHLQLVSGKGPRRITVSWQLQKIGRTKPQHGEQVGENKSERITELKNELLDTLRHHSRGFSPRRRCWHNSRRLQWAASCSRWYLAYRKMLERRWKVTTKRLRKTMKEGDKNPDSQHFPDSHQFSSILAFSCNSPAHGAHNIVVGINR